MEVAEEMAAMAALKAITREALDRPVEELPDQLLALPVVAMVEAEETLAVMEQQVRPGPMVPMEETEPPCRTEAYLKDFLCLVP